MIFDYLLFPLFILCILSLGAFFDLLISKLIQYQGKVSEDLSTQGLLGFFFLGILSVITNFIFPLSSPIFLIALLIIMVFGVVFLIKQWPLASKPELIFLVLSTFLLVPLVSKMGPGNDAGLYHLPHQLWLREERIVFGLANFHGRFGFSSIFEYISAPLWVNDQFKLLSYSVGAFCVFFTTFLVSKAISSNGPALALIMGILVNLTLYFGYLKWGYTSTDIQSGFLFVIAFFYGYWILYSDKLVSRCEWAIFSLMTLFAVLMKPTTGILIIWVLFVITYLFISKSTTRREFLMGSYVSIVIFSIWLVRSIIVSGCLLYPEKLSCIDVSWVAKTNALNDSNWITAWARHPRSGLNPLYDTSWFSAWWLPTYRGFLLNIRDAGFWVILSYVSFSAISKFRNVRLIDIRHIVATIIIIFSATLWFWKTPTPRFGIGIFILCIPLIFIFILGKSNNVEYVKTQRAVIMFLSVILLSRISLPWRATSTQELVQFRRLSVPTPAVKDDDIFGVRPRKGNRCWLVPECSPYDRNNIENIFVYRAFLLKD